MEIEVLISFLSGGANLFPSLIAANKEETFFTHLLSALPPEEITE
jgi:hypothetical protein